MLQLLAQLIMPQSVKSTVKKVHLVLFTSPLQLEGHVTGLQFKVAGTLNDI
jgi:hypothetical protein